MSKQSGEFLRIIERAKRGDESAIAIMRDVIARVAEGKNTPLPVLIEVAEVIVRHRIEEGRKDAENN